MLGTNSYMFRHQGAILREFNNNKKLRIQQYFRGYSPWLSALKQYVLNCILLLLQ